MSITEIVNFAQQIFVKQGTLGVQKNMGEPGGAWLPCPPRQLSLPTGEIFHFLLGSSNVQV